MYITVYIQLYILYTINTYSFVRVSRVPSLTGASIVSRYIIADSIISTGSRYRALVHILAMHLAVADVARFAFA